MPHEAMNVEQVGRYLKLTVEEVIKRASRGQIPARRVRGEFQFLKGEVDHWVETNMPELSHDRLGEIEHGVSAHHGFDPHQKLLMALAPPGGVVAVLPAKTRDAAIRCLVEAAQSAGLVYDAARLVSEVRQREDLCPTAIAPHVALPHPRHPLPYDIAESFVIVGRTPGEIPFGAPDGTLTRLFFLICCKDDRTHLHVLARISRILDDETIAALLEAPDAEAMRAILDRRETAVVASTRPEQAGE
jgi:PTS system nitrogen regulatory IIA component